MNGYQIPKQIQISKKWIREKNTGSLEKQVKFLYPKFIHSICIAIHVKKWHRRQTNLRSIKPTENGTKKETNIHSSWQIFQSVEVHIIREWGLSHTWNLSPRNTISSSRTNERPTGSGLCIQSRCLYPPEIVTGFPGNPRQETWQHKLIIPCYSATWRGSCKPESTNFPPTLLNAWSISLLPDHLVITSFFKKYKNYFPKIKL